MSKLVYKLVLDFLCNNQGSADFQSLNAHISQQYTVEEDILRSILFDDDKIAIGEGAERASGALLSPDSVVVAKTCLRLCQNKTCRGCDKLHLCRYYVCGDCSFKDKCKNSHCLNSPYNATVLGRSGLPGLTEKQLFQLLLQNDPYLLPEICSHYNKGMGESGSCRFASNCTKLHMCQHFLQGDCRFGSKCKRAHTFDAQGMNLFKQYSRDNVSGLLKIYRNKHIILGQFTRPSPVVSPVLCPAPLFPSKTLPSKSLPAPLSPFKTPPSNAIPATSSAPPKAVSDTDRNEICLYFLRRHCSFKERCARVHWHLPYKWEMWDGASMTWKNMNDMEEIEKAYCNPANDTSCPEKPTSPSGILRFLSLSSAGPVVESVDFLKMMCGSSAVRRLSSASSVTNPPHYILTTEWLWYWKDESGIWVEYGMNGSEGTGASMSSKTLENLYQADKELETEFKAGKHNYRLSFKGAHGLQMYQQNTKHHTIREVRRRPQFVSMQDVEVKLGSPVSQNSSSSTADATPSNWDQTALPEIGFKLVPLSPSSNEYNMISKLFKATMPLSVILSIQRIQNPSLWRIFQWQKEQMKKRNSGKSVMEKHLFHGTDKSLIEAICDQNFDWRMCGVHGTNYGKGSYFARDASYSNRFAPGQQGKVMFVALVLVGEFTRGRSTYVRPPPKRDGRTLYDSCVDSEADPGIFVIFEKQQIYPEYLIDYI